MNCLGSPPSSAEHLLAEHRRLHAMLRLARSAILHSGGPDRSGAPADVVRVLREVRDAFTRHFAQEDASHCLDEVMASCPELSDPVQRVQGEHSELVVDIDKLIAQALDGAQSVEDRIAIEKDFDDLCEKLYAHEAAENHLLRQGLAQGLSNDPHATITAHDASARPFDSDR